MDGLGSQSVKISCEGRLALNTPGVQAKVFFLFFSGACLPVGRGQVGQCTLFSGIILSLISLSPLFVLLIYIYLYIKNWTNFKEPNLGRLQNGLEY